MTKFIAKFKEKPLLCTLSIVFLVAALFLRFFALKNKPIHFDESINMWFVQRIWDDGFFTYDPTNYHGPLMFYMIHFMQFFTGFDFVSTRLVASVFAFLTLAILWFGPVRERAAFRWSAVLLLVSPAMGFYGRSGIHESAFVFFQVLGFFSFHYLVAKDYGKFWLAFCGGLLGMMALKETFVVLVLALIPAFALVALTERKKIPYKKYYREVSQEFLRRDVCFPVLGMLILFVGVYSGFGSNPKGLADFFVALMPWLKTGVHGNGHEKEFLHWTKLMGQNEFFLLVGFFGGFFYLLRNRWLRFYMVFTFFLWLIYSLIPYKTPWCIISILWPFGVVSGFVMDELTDKLPKKFAEIKRTTAIVVVAGLGLAEARILYNVTYADPIDMTHPYVYVNSTYQMKEFVTKTQELLEEKPLLREQIVQIGSEESWPMPIVFYKFYNLSYFRTNAKIEEDALIYFVDAGDKKTMEDKLTASQQAANYRVFSLDVRQSRAPIYVYVKKDFFENRFSWELKEVGTL